jgi:hypothetical protein
MRGVLGFGENHAAAGAPPHEEGDLRRLGIALGQTLDDHIGAVNEREGALEVAEVDNLQASGRAADGLRVHIRDDGIGEAQCSQPRRGLA